MVGGAVGLVVGCLMVIPALLTLVGRLGTRLALPLRLAATRYGPAARTLDTRRRRHHGRRCRLDCAQYPARPATAGNSTTPMRPNGP